MILTLIILHHFHPTYNYFFIFSVTYKKASGKTTKWVIFPEVVKNVLNIEFSERLFLTVSLLSCLFFVDISNFLVQIANRKVSQKSLSDAVALWTGRV